MATIKYTLDEVVKMPKIKAHIDKVVKEALAAQTKQADKDKEDEYIEFTQTPIGNEADAKEIDKVQRIKNAMKEGV